MAFWTTFQTPHPKGTLVCDLHRVLSRRKEYLIRLVTATNLRPSLRFAPRRNSGRLNDRRCMALIACVIAHDGFRPVEAPVFRPTRKCQTKHRRRYNSGISRAKPLCSLAPAARFVRRHRRAVTKMPDEFLRPFSPRRIHVPVSHLPVSHLPVSHPPVLRTLPTNLSLRLCDRHTQNSEPSTPNYKKDPPPEQPPAAGC